MAGLNHYSQLGFSAASATYNHGMLELTLPLRESVKPRRIEVKAGDHKTLHAA